MTNNSLQNYLFKNYEYIFFIIFFIVGLLSFKDYGISWDEKMSRGVGFLNGKYILENYFNEIYQKIIYNNENIKFGKLENYNLENYPERAYGVSFELPMALIEFVSNIKEINKVFLLRHFVTFVIFFISSIFFYKLLINLGYSKLISIIGFGILVTTPRIFAESFYNSKDLVFLSYMIISHYYGLKLINKNKPSNFFLFSFFTALSAGLRIIGLANLFFYIFVLFYKQKKIKLFFSIKLIILTFLFLYLFWPFLWEKPIENFLFAINFFSEVPWQGNEVFYLGSFYNSDNLPWHYTIVWIGVTTPFIYIVIFFFSIVALTKKIELSKFNINYCYLIYLILPLILVILFKPIQIDGWRHFYFLYPIIIIIILNIFNLENKILKLFFKFIIIVNIIFISTWNFINHPNQYLYFNNFFTLKSIKYFEKDYWGLSNKKLIEEILKIDQSTDIYYKSYNSNFEASLSFFPRNISSKFKKIDDSKDINRYYIFINNRFFDKTKIQSLIKETKTINEFNFNNSFINGVYLKEVRK